MKIHSRRKIERVVLLIKETDKDKGVALKWLNRNRFVPTGDKKPVHRVALWHSQHPGKKQAYPGGFKDALKIVKGMFFLTVERMI